MKGLIFIFDIAVCSQDLKLLFVEHSEKLGFKYSGKGMTLCVFIYHNTPNSIYCLKYVQDYSDYGWGSTISIIYLLTFDILMPSGLLITAQMLICYSTHSLVTQCLTDGM